MNETLLPLLNITQTEFFTVQLKASANVRGIPIGTGACKAVRLRVNVLVRNSQTATPIAANERLVYYGDRNSQEFELYAGDGVMFTPSSELIICQDLSEVYIRSNGAANVVQVLKYL